MSSAGLFGGGQDLLKGVGDIFAGFEAADASRDAARFYTEAATDTDVETGIKQTAASRAIYQTLGAASADTAANGFQMGGSAADIMRSSAQQGALTHGMIALQGEITSQGYTAQAQAARTQANAQQTGGLISGAGSLIGALAMFSDDRLKSEITLVERRDCGIHRYRFRYENSDVFYVGVLASEVEMVTPAAVTEGLNGYRLVNYDMIGVPLVVEGAL